LSALARLVRKRFIVREPGSDTRHSMVDALGRHHAHLNVALEIKSTATIKQAVIAGLGVAFLSGHTVSRELRDGSLALLDVAGFPVMLSWYLVHRRNKRLPPVALAFRDDLLREGAARIEQLFPAAAAARARTISPGRAAPSRRPPRRAPGRTRAGTA
jgi:DNA-binding transcriptional LysR family regulator